MSAPPISTSFRRILLGVIENASRKSEQKRLLMIAYEEGVLNAREVDDLMRAHELAGA